jgi:hypothetical protein
VARLPFTPLQYTGQAFDLTGAADALLEPEDVLPISANNDDARAPTTSCIRFLVLREGGDEPLRAFAVHRPPLRTSDFKADEPRRCRLPKKRACGTGPTRAKVRAVFRRANPLLEPVPHTSLSREHGYERRTLSRMLLPPGCSFVLRP